MDNQFKPVKYNVGESFTMIMPLPPDLAKQYGKTELFVSAIYLRAFDSKFVNEQIDAGTLKQMLHNPFWEKHHIVSFGGDNWINDLLPKEGAKMTFTPIDLDTEN